MLPIRIIIRNPVLSLFSLPVSLLSQDSIPKESETVKNKDSTEYKETGIDRLRRMITLDDSERIGPEISSIIQVGSMSLFVGALYGGVISSRTAYQDFINNNQATMFKHHFEAKKKLQDKMTLSFGKGALRWAWRLAAFSTSYMTVTTVISVYRGKFGIIEHTIAGATSGLLYKLPIGPKAMIVGSVLGSVIGTFAGIVTYSLLTLSGLSWDEVRYWQYQWKEARHQKFKSAIDSQKEKEEMQLLHDQRLGDTGNNIGNIDVNLKN